MDLFDLMNAAPGLFDPGTTNPYESLFSGITGPGFDQDYSVTQSGLIQDAAGNVGKFTGGSWVPYLSGDVTSFLKGADTSTLGSLLSGLKNVGGKAVDFATSRGGVAGIAALLAALDRQRPSGGGVKSAYAGYKPMTRTMTQGRYGPVARYAADGGLMQAYAQGGAVRPFPMQDGGFVMTKRAVDGAGGPQGMQQRVPEAVPIRGPGHGTSDSIPAYIQGDNGRTPAKVSNGEMYVPPGRNTQGLYALMRSLERKA